MNILAKLSVVLFLVIGLTGLHAQEAIPASGGNASGSGGTVSYTVGQVVYTSNTGANGTVAQGVQQPFEISVVTGIEEAKGISLEMVVYPNPTSDFIRLIIENYDIKNLNYQLYNINGSLLLGKEIESQESYISMQTFAPASYFLKVFQDKRELKTFKIIKN